VQVGAHAMADRYTYFPSIGLFLAVVWGAGQLRSGATRRAATAAAVVVLAALALRTDRQVRLWEDDERLFRQAIAATGPNVRAHEMLANVLQNRGRNEEAYEHLQEAIRIVPNPHSLAAAGGLLVKLGYPDRAEKIYAVSLSMDPQQADAALGLARLLVQSGRQAEACEAWQLVLGSPRATAAARARAEREASGAGCGPTE